MTSSSNMQLKEFPGTEWKREVGGNRHLIDKTKYPRIEVDHKTLDSKVNGTEWKNKTQHYIKKL